MAYAQILQRLLQRFFMTMGRAPVTPNEWSKLRKQAMELARKEGDPITGAKIQAQPKLPFDTTKDLPSTGILQKRGEIIPFPKRPSGPKFQKMSGGVENLLKTGQARFGKAPRTTKLTLDRKKESLEGQINKEKWIARKKQENKDAIRRFKEKNPKTVEDFRDKGDWDPGGMAYGGIAPLVGEPSYAANFYDDRIPMAGGGALFKFIEKLFIKASNDIRLARGKWKGLDQKQRIVQHDNLTKKVTEFQKTGKLPEGTEQYFDVNPNEAFAAAQAKATRLGKKGPHWKEQEVQGQMDEIAGGVDERTMLKQKYPGITDDLVEKILIDQNPQRKAEVYSTIDQYMKLKEIGKSEAEAYDIITKSFSKNPTKHAEGGRIGFNPGGPVDQEALIQMYIAEGLSYEEAVQAAQSAANLPWDTLKKAEGGRADFIFGGSAGLRAMWKKMMQGISKRRGGKPITKLFPKLSADERRMEKLVMGTPEQKAFREGEEAYKLEGIDLLINRLRHDKKIIERQAKNKAMNDPSLNFLMKDLEKSMSDAYGPHLKKYTDIDKDILQMENIKKNLIMKDRKLNAEGGRIEYAGGGKAGLPAITQGSPQGPAMQQPQMPGGPQPTGIPGGTIVAQNQMQQNPWMGSQMQQGIGGMPRPGGMPQRGQLNLVECQDLNLVECQDLWQLKAEELVLV